MKTSRGAVWRFPGGQVAIAVTARGLRACSFFHRSREAAQAVIARSPVLRGLDLAFDDGPWSAPWFEAIAAHFNCQPRLVPRLRGIGASCGGFDRGQPQPVKLDLSGSSDFARRVYRAALRIRPGETISYGELASRIGRPGAARAVGRALAANPVAPVVPCHRIVAANGALTGYSGPGGLRAKARLLAREELDLRGLPREGAEGS